jgi:hypothetical protein
MKKLLMLVAAATIGLGAMNAQAADNRMLPGLLCQKIDGNGIPIPNWQGAILNMSTTDMLRVACPIVRDNETSAPSSITVNVVQPAPNSETCCQFYSVDPASGGIFWGNAQACTPPNGWGGSPQQLHPSTASGSFANGSELLFCFTPPVVNGQIPSILSYQVQE